MGLDDYQKANCALYRLPPIDTSAVASAIELTLVRAWEQGLSADRALHSVLNDQNVVGALTEQVAKHLEYQRRTALMTAKEQSMQSIKQYEEAAAAKLAQVDASYGTVATQKAAAFQHVSDQLAQQNVSYTAAQKKLEELRARVQQRLQEVGGEQGLQALLTIHESVTNPQDSTFQQLEAHDQDADSSKSTSQSTAQAYASQEQKGASDDSSADSSSAFKKHRSVQQQAKSEQNLEKALQIAMTTDTVDPLKGDTLEKVVARSMQQKKKPGKTYRFFASVWKILNYKLW